MFSKLVKKYRYSYFLVCVIAALIMLLNILIPQALFVISAVVVVVIDFGLCVSSITLVRLSLIHI